MTLEELNEMAREANRISDEASKVEIETKGNEEVFEGDEDDDPQAIENLEAEISNAVALLEGVEDFLDRLLKPAPNKRMPSYIDREIEALALEVHAFLADYQILDLKEQEGENIWAV